MANAILETYKKRLAISEAVYSKTHNGNRMDNNRKITVATVLNNTTKFLNEAMQSVSANGGTQSSDMGLWKKFVLNLTTVALPNLIAQDLVIVHPMTSMSGYVTYIEYLSAKDKGETSNGDLFNSPFKLGKVDSNFTADKVVETAAAAGEYTVSWTPVVKGTFNHLRPEGVTDQWDVKLTHVDGTVGYAAVDAATGKIVGNVNVGDKIAYQYNNVVIPQNDLPAIRAEMKSIALIAKARRISVYYSQMAAFQAKTDYGMDLGDSLAEQAVARLSYELDTEVVELLDKTAGNAMAELTWSKTLPVGVSKQEHYQGFTEILEIGRQLIYDRTQRFAPNYMICASNLLPILAFINGWTAAPAGQVNGPYLAGTLNGLRVYISPALAPGRFVIGVNGDDMMSSVAVYAPYMAIVPTQLLQFADGATSQGWSTLYDLKVLNGDLIVAGQLTA